MSRPLRILLCDDNVDGANTMALWLRIDGHDVRVVHNGPAALEAARAWPPEAVLLDIGLPGKMDGFETARRLRGDLGLTEPLLVAVTGRSHDEDRQHSQDAGFDLHLVKPVEPEVLQEALAKARPSGAQTGTP